MTTLSGRVRARATINLSGLPHGTVALVDPNDPEIRTLFDRGYLVPENTPGTLLGVLSPPETEPVGEASDGPPGGGEGLSGARGAEDAGETDGDGADDEGAVVERAGTPVDGPDERISDPQVGERVPPRVLDPP